MVIYFEKQTDFWKEIFLAALLVQEQTRNYLQKFPGGFSEKELEDMIAWEEIDEAAIHD